MFFNMFKKLDGICAQKQVHPLDQSKGAPYVVKWKKSDKATATSHSHTW